MKLAPNHNSAVRRRLIPDSFIVAAPKQKLNAPSSGQILGETDEMTFSVVSASDVGLLSRADDIQIFPNYEYSGEVFDAPIHSQAQRSEIELPLHLEVIDIKKAWAVTKGSPEVVSAITDSGPDFQHPSLKDAIWQNPGEIPHNGIDDDENGKVDDVVGWDFSDNDGEPGTEDGTHHTHVMGIVHAKPGVGESVGVAPETKGMTIRIGGGKRRYSTALMVEAYLYAMEQGAKSINTSMNVDGFVRDRAMQRVYRSLAENDVLVFNSAGNEGRRNPKRGALEDIVLVAATQTAPGVLDERSEFSNYGSEIDISAPGSDILSTLPNGRTGAISGTSMAAPQVMGVDLLLQSAHPDWNRAQRWAQIAGTTDPLKEDGENIPQMGYGRLNAGRALTEELPAPTITPILSTFPNGQTMDVTLRFDKVIDPKLANEAEAWKIVNGDGETVMSGSPKEIRLMTNQIKFNVAKLPKGQYQLIGSADHLKDPFGKPLDGNKDGKSGDDLVVDFQRIS